eukprot:TRINITY_DN19207_c0_g1_i1.p3 TRINITY_DN19207_c0_g1~~TRINITY_DN19207_c0_g1_i1.p3  ORF type:complete len:108 (-),score=18.75 TRINITY_DN19207_c0_g1_i1:251-574(-)
MLYKYIYINFFFFFFFVLQYDVQKISHWTLQLFILISKNRCIYNKKQIFLCDYDIFMIILFFHSSNMLLAQFFSSNYISFIRVQVYQFFFLEKGFTLPKLLPQLEQQ